MKVNLKKLGAVVAGAALLATSIAFAGLYYGDTALVNANGEPQVKVVVGQNAAASDGVAAANIAAVIANHAYAEKALTAEVTGEATCIGGEGGTCNVDDKTVTLEVSMPGLSSNMVNEFKLLIGEDVDMDVGDRDTTGDGLDVADDFIDEYANPYQNHMGDVVAASVPGKNNPYIAYAIGGNSFEPFKDYSVESKKYGIHTTEQQKFYIEGKSVYNDEDVAFKGESAVYQIFFGGDDKGLPLCPGDEGTTLYNCGDDDRIGSARYIINFLGEPWVISDLKYNDNALSAAITDEDQVSTPNGDDFTLFLAKEAQYGILNIGDCLVSDDVRVCLGDIARETGKQNIHPAIINVYVGDSTEPAIKDQVDPGTTKNIYVNGKEYKVHVYQTAPGYTLGEKWAEMAIYKDEIELHNSKTFLDYDDKDSDWEVYFGLMDKNGGATSVGNTTHLKEIIFATDEKDAFSSANNGKIFPGESMKVLDLEGYQTYELYNNGLDDVDMDSLEMTLEKDNDDFDYVDSTGTEQTVRADYYVTITSKQDKAFKADAQGGTIVVKGKEIKVVVNESSNELVLLKSYSDNKYYQVDLSSNAVEFDYDYAGKDDGKFIVDLDNHDNSGSTSDGEFDLILREEVGEVGSTDDIDSVYTGVILDAGDPTFTSDVPGGTPSDDDEMGIAMDSYFANYGYDADGSVKKVNDEGFITPRGSVFDEISSTSRTILVASKVRHLDMLFKPTEESADKINTQTCGPLREGQSCKVGDVTVTVKSIDVATSVGGSGAAGTCDMSGVSAVIKADGQPVGDNAKLIVPYAVQGNLVVLDSEVSATDTGTIITVGGPAVNSVTAEALPEGITADEPVVVKQVGNKIVVAGYTADDTLQAAQQFISSLTTQ